MKTIANLWFKPKTYYNKVPIITNNTLTQTERIQEKKRKHCCVSRCFGIILCNQLCLVALP